MKVSSAQLFARNGTLFQFLVAGDRCGLVQENLTLQFSPALYDVHVNAFDLTVVLTVQLLPAQN